jgi:hypothetical protein
MSTKIYCVTGSLEKICPMEANRYISAYMNLYPHFPCLLLCWGKIWYKESQHNAIRIYGLHEHWCGKSHTFLTSVNKITLMCISTSFTVYPPHHYCSTYILHINDAWRCFVRSTASIMYGQLTTTLLSKNIMLCLLVVPHNQSFQEHCWPG